MPGDDGVKIQARQTKKTLPVIFLYIYIYVSVYPDTSNSSFFLAVWSESTTGGVLFVFIVARGRVVRSVQRSRCLVMSANCTLQLRLLSSNLGSGGHVYLCMYALLFQLCLLLCETRCPGWLGSACV